VPGRSFLQLNRQWKIAILTKGQSQLGLLDLDGPSFVVEGLIGCEF
jgi:hypothetical protein